MHMKRFVILLVVLFWFCYLINGGFEGYVVSFFAAVIFSLIFPSWDDCSNRISGEDIKRMHEDFKCKWTKRQS